MMIRNIKDLDENQRETLSQLGRKIGSCLKLDQDDYFLLKWLQATNFDVQQAEDMFRQSLWVRKKFGLETILEDYKPPEVLEKYDPGGFFGYDKEGFPIFIDPVGKIDFKGLLHSARREEVLRFKGMHAEQGMQLAKDQSKKLGKRIDKVVTILDMEGLGMKHLWTPGVALFNSVLHFYESNYPGYWKQILVIKAPALFPVAYSLVKPFLSEYTRGQIKVLGSDWKKELQEYVDEDNLPEFYGGKCRDEKDDPKCATKICYGGDIPESFHVAQKPFGEAEGTKVTVVERGKILEIRGDVTTSATTIRWDFRTKENDVGFGVFFAPPPPPSPPAESKSDKPSSPIKETPVKNVPSTASEESTDEEKKSSENGKQDVTNGKDNGKNNSKENGHQENDLEELLPIQRVDSHLIPEQGCFKCDKTGTYVLRFDNSYSWIRSKDLEYKIEGLANMSLVTVKGTK
ncbi:SEC14-like protein 2 [Nematostella vectensis]|uniref:SEC14-like protein 2 n=1 Tax=Nematostella vectensis TaxID=45351 RepID=UPI002076D89F|nr:SEC14-like protein 2 [Nematostella vectensis]